MKKTIIMGLILVINPIVAMDCNSDSHDILKICYLTWLPQEILDHIASYLPFNNRESKEEFIERTKIPEVVPSHYYFHFLHVRLAIDFPGIDERGVRFSPNRSKILLIEKLYDAYNTKVSIIDYKNKDYTKQREHSDTIARNIDTNLIALSPSGKQFAIIQEKRACTPTRPWSSFNDLFTKVLVLNNIITNKSEDLFVMPSDFGKIKSIDFNKQGTQIIMHESDCGNESKYHIIPIVPEAEHRATSIKDFNTFLYQHAICKQLVQPMSKSSMPCIMQ